MLKSKILVFILSLRYIECACRKEKHENLRSKYEGSQDSSEENSREFVHNNAKKDTDNIIKPENIKLFLNLFTSDENQGRDSEFISNMDDTREETQTNIQSIPDEKDYFKILSEPHEDKDGESSLSGKLLKDFEKYMTFSWMPEVYADAMFYLLVDEVNEESENNNLQEIRNARIFALPPDEKNGCINSILQALVSCPSITEFITKHKKSDKINTFFHASEIFKFVDEYNSILSKKRTVLSQNKLKKRWNRITAELIVFIRARNRILVECSIKKIIFASFFTCLMSESKEFGIIPSEIPFASITISGQRCSNCNNITTESGAEILFCFMKLPFAHICKHRIIKYFIDLKNQRFYKRSEKCCDDPTLGPNESWLGKFAKILIIDTMEPGGTEKPLPCRRHVIPQRFHVKEKDTKLLYELKAGVFTYLNETMSMIKRGSDWFLIGKRVKTNIEPEIFLRKDLEWFLLYEMTQLQQYKNSNE